MFPRAGGMYHFLKEAYGPLAGFLFGWGSFLVIMSGGIAALAAGFGEYLGGFVPFFSTRHVLASVPIGTWSWKLTGGGVAGSPRDRVPDRGQLRRRQGGRLGPEPRHGPEDRIARGARRRRPLRRRARPAGSRGAASAGRARPLRRRDDRRAVGLRRLVLLRSLGGRDARSGPQHPARPDHRDRRAHRDLRADQLRLSAGASDSRPVSNASRRRGGGAGAPRSGGGAPRLRGHPGLDLRLPLRQHPHLLAHLPADGGGRPLLPVARADQPAPPRPGREPPRAGASGRASSSSPGPSSSSTPTSSSSRSSPTPRPEPPSTSCAARSRRRRAPTGPGAIHGCRPSSSSLRSPSWRTP